MSKCIFVTATNTDAGKTHISGLILKALCEERLLTVGFKPLASGDYPYNSDAEWLQQLSSLSTEYNLINPWCFEPPIAPHIAAKKAGVEVTHSLLSEHLNVLRRKQPDLILTEGAGGWLLPINNSETLNEWVVSEGMAVIMVVAMELGCLNHALLTARAIEQDGGRLIGWIANQPRPQPMLEYAENLAYLQSHLTAPCLAEVHFSNTPQQEELADSDKQKVLTAIDCIELPR